MIRIKIWNLATELKHHNRQPIVLLGIKSGAIGRKSQLFYVNSTTATPINLIWKMHNIYSFSILNYQKCNLKYFNPSIRDRVLCSGMLLYLHHINLKIFFIQQCLTTSKMRQFQTIKLSQFHRAKYLLD